jgi:sulfonate transport system substrate-binding protein
MMLTRRHSLATLAATGLSVLARPALAQTIVRFSYQRSSTLLTLLKLNRTLEAKFAPLGYGISWHLFDNVIDAMTTGAVDFHSDVADAVPVFTQAQGAPLDYYAEEEGSPSAEAIIVRDSAPIRSIADLKGKTVAVHRGSGCHFVLATALASVGLSFNDIRPAYLRPADAGPAFERGDVDAWVIWDPYLAITEAKLKTRTIHDATGYSSYRRYYMVGSAFAAAHADLVQIVYDALVETGHWIKSHPSAAIDTLRPVWGNLAPDVIATVNRRRTYDVRPVTVASLGEQQKIADTFYAAGLIPKPIEARAGHIWQAKTDRT